MDYVSDKQRKAVMAKYNNDGLLYEKFRDYSYDYSCGSYPSNRYNDSKGWTSHPLNEQRNKKTFVKTMIEEILALKTIEYQEEKILLSRIFNNIISIAEENGTDKSIIIELREIQQQLIRNTPSKIWMTKLKETQQKMEKGENGITKNIKCPHCDKLFQAEFSCNQHIKDKHGVS